jgi:NhaP-type Na+/H+ or K+/H+ antiporter
MVFDARLPGNTTLMPVVAFTVLLSVIAHGITANPLTRAITARRGPAIDPTRALER